VSDVRDVRDVRCAVSVASGRRVRASLRRNSLRRGRKA
jgi:hypothetical protein